MAPRTPAPRRITRALTMHPDGLTLHQLAPLARLGKTRTAAELTALIGNGTIVHNRRTDGKHYYSLNHRNPR